MPGLLRQAGLSGVTAGFAGDSALARETVNQTADGLWAIAVAALAADLLLLIVFLRALVAPLYLLAVSALVVAAALGLTAGLPGVAGPSLAQLLRAVRGRRAARRAGLRLQRLRRRPDLAGGTDHATPRGDPGGRAPRSRAIGVAGLALAGSFALLAIVSLVPFREFAFAMTVGVLIDSFLVRTLLVPSLMTLFSRSGRYPTTR